ncbi:MAG: RDD family protein [bacterium]
MKKLTSILKRFTASLIDLICLVLILLLNGVIISVLDVYYPYNIVSYFLIAFLFFVFNNAYLQGYRGYTIGKAFLRIRVYNPQGKCIGIYNSFMREIAKISLSLCFFLGFFIAIGDKNKQAWHDKIAETYVVEEENSSVFCFDLMRPIKKKYIRFFKEYDIENNAFLNEIGSLADSNRCYKVYINPEGLITKFGYFIDGELVNYTKFVYEDYSTTVYEYSGDGKFTSGQRHIFNKDGIITKSISIDKQHYEKEHIA